MGRRRRAGTSMRITRMSAVRRKNVADYFLSTSRWHRAWLIELAGRYKAKGDFPLFAVSILPSYYEDVRDKEVAAFACLLINDSEKTFERVSVFRKMFGKSPWEWFEKRMFVGLSVGKRQNYRTAGILNRKIAELFGRLWDECHAEEESSFVRPIGDTVIAIADERACSFYDALVYLLEGCFVGNYQYKLRLFLLILARSDGFSIGLWTIEPSELKCPVTRELRMFLETFFPDYRRYGDIDDAISLFGFDCDCDFFYAYLGYRELQRRNPSECGECATRYMSWYLCGTVMKPNKWRGIIPKTEI